VPTSPSSPELRAFLDEVGARVQLLRESIERQSVLESIERLDSLFRAGLLTPEFLRALQSTNPWFKRRLSGKTEKLLKQGLPRCPSHAGRVLVPLVVLASEHGLLTEDLVLTRRLTCQVDSRKELSLATASVASWESNLRRVCRTVAPVVASIAPRATADWDVGHVGFDLWSTGTMRPEGHSISSRDRSYELGAAVALISACFSKALSPGLAAMGLVEDDGDIKPLPPDVLIAKCRGLAADFPPLESVLVPPEQANLARDHLPPLVEVMTVQNIDELPDALGVEAASFKGRCRQSILSGAASIPRALVGIVSGSTLVAERGKTDEGMGELTGRGHGTSIGLGMVCAFICLARLEPALGNWLAQHHFLAFDPESPMGGATLRFLDGRLWPHLVLGLCLPLFSIASGLSVGAALGRRAPHLVAKWPRGAILLTCLLLPSKLLTTKTFEEYTPNAWSTFVYILVVDLLLIAPCGFNFACGWLPTESWIGKCAEGTLLWLLFWRYRRGRSASIVGEAHVERFCIGVGLETTGILTLAGCVFITTGETLLLAMLPLQLAAILLAVAQLKPSKRGIRRQRLRRAAMAALVGGRGCCVVALLLSLVAVCSEALPSMGVPQFVRLLDVRLLGILRDPRSVPTWQIAMVSILLLGSSIFWLRGFFDRYAYCGPYDKASRTAQIPEGD
jgi:hypothetical protein